LLNKLSKRIVLEKKDEKPMANTKHKEKKHEMGKKRISNEQDGCVLVGFNCFCKSFGLKIKSRLDNNVVTKRIN
jgi:hypothetical protein